MWLIVDTHGSDLLLVKPLPAPSAFTQVKHAAIRTAGASYRVRSIEK